MPRKPETSSGLDGFRERERERERDHYRISLCGNGGCEPYARPFHLNFLLDWGSRFLGGGRDYIEYPGDGR
jgi:hypothetical protein